MYKCPFFTSKRARKTLKKHLRTYTLSAQKALSHKSVTKYKKNTTF